MQIGAQLYTCHNRMKTLEDLELTLKRVAQIGYRSVQVSGACAFEPEWMRDKLEENGLVCSITHIPYKDIVERTERVVEEHRVFGCSRIGLGSMPKELRTTWDGYNLFVKQMRAAAHRMRDMGATLHYHNHWWEFNALEGADLLRRMAEDFREDGVEFTLDLGWAAFGGQDVVKLIHELDGKLSCIHLKDYRDLPEDGSITTKTYLRPIYEGKLDYDAYIQALEQTNCEYMLVEQDWCYDEDEFECLRRSYENVTKRFPQVK